MPEIGMSVSMSGDGKRSVGHRPQATAPILDSTGADSFYRSPPKSSPPTIAIYGEVTKSTDLNQSPA
jgi:hypothetical protein